MNRLLPIVLLLITRFTFSQSTIQLFNGKNLDGWYAYKLGSGKHTNAFELFSVEDHMIRLYGDKTGYLMSEQSFRNFS